MFLKKTEKKKLPAPIAETKIKNKKALKGNENNYEIIQKQPPQVSYKKEVQNYFGKFTQKHLCRGIFLIRFQT